jgi:predicted Rossmann-fold nucleotide-binding protein
MNRRILVAIGASSDPNLPSAAADKARRFAWALLRYRDEVILMSGGDGGLMRIACREFVEGGRLTIGIIPVEDEVIGEDHPRYSPYNVIPILSGMTYQMRSIRASLAVSSSPPLAGSHTFWALNLSLSLKNGNT